MTETQSQYKDQAKGKITPMTFRLINNVLNLEPRVASVVRRYQSWFPNLTHSMNNVRARYTSVPVTTLDLNGLTVEGMRPANWIRMMIDPSFIFNELAQWRVSLSFTNLFAGKWNEFFDLQRIPTLREMFEYVCGELMKVVRGFKNAAVFIIKWLPFIMKITFPLVVLMYGLFILQLLTRGGNYKTFTPGQNIQRGQRPDSVRNLQPAAQNRYDVDTYPAKNRKTAERLMHTIDEIDDKLNDFDSVLCKCGFPITGCNCPNPGDYQPFALASLNNDRSKLERQLDLLMGDLELPAFQIGERLRYQLCPNIFFAALDALCADFKVTWEVVDAFETGDTRPSHEQHISLSNTKFYVVHQKDMRIKIRFLWYKKKYAMDTRWLTYLMVPSRDLVVAEDHIRATRRGRLETDADKTLKAILQTSMATPINDPDFIRNKVDPLRDAYLVTRAIMKGFVPAYVDF